MARWIVIGMKRHVNILDRIGSLIPGYSGYAKRDNQGRSDKLLRDQIASRLDAAENKISDIQKNALRGEIGVDLLVLEELRKGCSTLCSKIRHAAYGVSACCI
jgi:hypothetical protein